jgi:hypothetical protein
MSAADRQRLKAVRRVAQLRDEMKRIEEIKLARLTAEEAELEEKRAIVIATLNDDTRLHGLFVDAMAARLKRVDERQSALQPLKAAQQRAVLNQARLAKYAETMTGRLARQVQAADDRRDLERLMEQVLARRGDASLPQACPAKVASVASAPSEATSATGDNRTKGPISELADGDFPSV